MPTKSLTRNQTYNCLYLSLIFGLYNYLMELYCHCTNKINFAIISKNNHRRMLKYLVIFILAIVSQNLLAQHIDDNTLYNKVKINLVGKDIKQLALLGIETDHGILAKDRFLINDYSLFELEQIRNAGFEFQILIEDVSSFYADPNRPSFQKQQDFKNQSSYCPNFETEEYNYKTPNQYFDGSMGGYFTLKEMYDILDTMHQRYPHLITLRQPISLIETHDGNLIYYVKVSDLPEIDEEHEPEVLYTALHHAREPNSLSQMIFYLWYLLENYETDPTIKLIVDQTQMYFIPCINPDGYLLNERNDPEGGGMWRKNTFKNDLGELKGVDLNRNYGHFWGFDNQGSSPNENSQVYRGKNAFSEPETQNIKEFCLSRRFQVAQNYHTFGNLLIHPWGYDSTPTDEDAIFKALAKVMTRENDFKVGTATETVGYIVNGSSDDWMYGGSELLSPIYAFTPEVGPSFWPSPDDIDYLNKSSLLLNINTALVTLNYLDASPKVDSDFLLKDNPTIDALVSNVSLKTSTAKVTLQSNTPGVVVLNAIRDVSVGVGEELSLNFELNIDPSFQDANIFFTLITDNMGGVLTTKTFSKKYLKSPLVLVWENKGTVEDVLQANGWFLTTEDFVSAPSSYTESPNSNYVDNTSATIIFKPSINLENTNIAILSFFAKWDIEARYDYAEISASNDNITYVPLCGKYTKEGSVNQVFESPIYDGSNLNWVKEEIDISEFVGKEDIYIKLFFKSDDFVTADGFYFDDMQILTQDKSSSSIDPKDLSQNSWKVVPTLFDQYLNIYFSDGVIKPNDYLDIYHVTGQFIKTISIDYNQLNVSTDSWSPGMYLLKWNSTGRAPLIKSVIKTN